MTALNLTSHQLYNVWLSNTLSISAAVLSRTIASYDDAYELAITQQKALERHLDHNDDRCAQQVFHDLTRDESTGSPAGPEVRLSSFRISKLGGANSFRRKYR